MVELVGVEDSVVGHVVHHHAARVVVAAVAPRVVDAEEVTALDGQRPRQVDAVDADGGRRQRDAVLQDVLVGGQLAPDADERGAVGRSAEIDDLAERRVARDAAAEHQTGAPVVGEVRQTGRLTTERRRTKLTAS